SDTVAAGQFGRHHDGAQRGIPHLAVNLVHQTFSPKRTKRFRCGAPGCVTTCAPSQRGEFPPFGGMAGPGPWAQPPSSSIEPAVVGCGAHMFTKGHKIHHFSRLLASVASGTRDHFGDAAETRGHMREIRNAVLEWLRTAPVADPVDRRNAPFVQALLVFFVIFVLLNKVMYLWVVFSGQWQAT